MRAAFISFGLIAVLWPAVAFAAFDTGNKLFDYCSKPDAFSEGMCFGLISGYFEGFNINYTCKKTSPEITRRQVRDVVFSYLQAHPEDRHLPGITLASRAYLVAFDCKQAK